MRSQRCAQTRTITDTTSEVEAWCADMHTYHPDMFQESLAGECVRRRHHDDRTMYTISVPGSMLMTTLFSAGLDTLLFAPPGSLRGQWHTGEGGRNRGRVVG